jgi:hypothetical protein
MNPDGEVQRLYYGTGSDESIMRQDALEDVVKYSDEESLFAYQAELDKLDKDLQAGVVAKSMTTGMGQYKLDATVESQTDTIDTMTEYYTGRNGATPPPATGNEYYQAFMHQSYGEFEITEDVTLELQSLSTFAGFSELDETALMTQ